MKAIALVLVFWNIVCVAPENSNYSIGNHACCPDGFLSMPRLKKCRNPTSNITIPFLLYCNNTFGIIYNFTITPEDKIGFPTHKLHTFTFEDDK